MSGAGKSSAVHVLEDMGHYCIDNIPPTLISHFVALCQNESVSLDAVAFVADARSVEPVTHLAAEIKRLKNEKDGCTVVFLDADDETLIKRYKETRRKHPHAENERIETGIRLERKLLSQIKQDADIVIDTSRLLVRELREKLVSVLGASSASYEPISIQLVSFGFKRGIPADCDTVFDVRFMPNPYYDETLKELTGKDKRVRDYALMHEDSQLFLRKVEVLFAHLLPLYIKEGRQSLVIGIGCTGGKHRSVAVSEELAKYFKQSNYRTNVTHRDIENK